jgi:predicted metal-dependent HD superfamily phosphohydrolase
MDTESQLLQKSRIYVEEFLKDNLSKGIYYHDLEHTQEVVEAAEEIGFASNLSEEQLETVLIAAWFHDTGYYKGMQDHEVNSKEVAEDFLRKEGVNDKKINDVSGCILATMIPQHPTNIMEEVLCDADLYHVSTKEFFKKSELLRKEFSLVFPDEIQLDEWFKKSIKFLKKHNFFRISLSMILKGTNRRNPKKKKMTQNLQGA